MRVWACQDPAYAHESRHFYPLKQGLLPEEPLCLTGFYLAACLQCSAVLSSPMHPGLWSGGNWCHQCSSTRGIVGA